MSSKIVVTITTVFLLPTTYYLLWGTQVVGRKKVVSSSNSYYFFTTSQIYYQSLNGRSVAMLSRSTAGGTIFQFCLPEYSSGSVKCSRFRAQK